MVSAKLWLHRNQSRIIAVAFILLLIIALRAYYYSGPIFANTQDEGIYLTAFANHVRFGDPIGFSQYRGANFSNYTNPLFNPANTFQFYVGFEYPIMFLMSILGYSANLAILYVIFTSIVEGLLVFLIVERISGLRAAMISGIIFAFLPVDVLFGTHVQPLVPMAMMVAASIYVFILAQSEEKKRSKYILMLMTGIFAGFAYITNPLAALLPIFLFVYVLFGIVKVPKSLRQRGKQLCFIALGFLIAYSTIGAFYLITSGNFLLYPMSTRADFHYILLTQPLNTYCAPQVLGHQICAQYALGMPKFYLSLLANMTVPSNQYVTYYGLTAFALLAALLLYFMYLRKDTGLHKMRFFTAMFLFYLIALTFLPMHLQTEGSKTIIFMADQQPYYSILLVLPMVAVLGIMLDKMMRMGSGKGAKWVVMAVCSLIIMIVAANVLVLNHDVSVYRNSMSTMHSFLGYVAEHPNATFYAEWLFSNTANLMSGFRYNISQLPCSLSTRISAQSDAYIVLGGTISMDIDPSALSNYAACVSANLTNSQPAYVAQNPYQPASPLRIIKVG